MKPDEWSLGTACSPGPYFTPQSLIKTRCGIAGPRQLILTRRRTFACSDTLGKEEMGRRSQLKSVQLANTVPAEVFSIKHSQFLNFHR